MRWIPLLAVIAIILAVLTVAAAVYVIMSRPVVIATPTLEPIASSLPVITPTPNTITHSSVSGLFTVAFPTDWEVTSNEGKRGVQLARINAQSPDFVVRSDDTVDGPFAPQYYEQGARIGISAIAGSPTEVIRELGANSEVITIANLPGRLRAQNQPSTVEGQDVEAMVHSNGINYHFMFTYNPATYPEGRAVFQHILNSFHLK